MTNHSPSTVDYEFTRGLRSVQFATGWLGRRAALRRLLATIDSWILAVRYATNGAPRLEVFAVSDQAKSYGWCRRCRLNRDHDLADAATMDARCRACGDVHTFRTAG